MATERPLSPHLTVYSWQITNTLSILHRITGFGLAIGSILLVIWLFSAAYNPPFYYSLHAFLGSLAGKLLLLGWTVAFYYHLANGIRHLLWDTGAGFQIPQVTRSGIFVLFYTAIMTAGTWAFILCPEFRL